MSDYEQGFVAGRILGVFLIPVFVWLIAASIRYMWWRLRSVEAAFIDALLSPLIMCLAMFIFIVSVVSFVVGFLAPSPNVPSARVPVERQRTSFSSQFLDGCVQGVGKNLGATRAESFCSCLARDVPKVYSDREFWEHQKRASNGQRIPEQLEEIIDNCAR